MGVSFRTRRSVFLWQLDPTSVHSKAFTANFAPKSTDLLHHDIEVPRQRTSRPANLPPEVKKKNSRCDVASLDGKARQGSAEARSEIRCAVKRLPVNQTVRPRPRVHQPTTITKERFRQKRRKLSSRTDPSVRKTHDGRWASEGKEKYNGGILQGYPISSLWNAIVHRPIQKKRKKQIQHGTQKTPSSTCMSNLSCSTRTRPAGGKEQRTPQAIPQKKPKPVELFKPN